MLVQYDKGFQLQSALLLAATKHVQRQMSPDDVHMRSRVVQFGVRMSLAKFANLIIAVCRT